MLEGAGVICSSKRTSADDQSTGSPFLTFLLVVVVMGVVGVLVYWKRERIGGMLQREVLIRRSGGRGGVVNRGYMEEEEGEED